MATGGGQFTGMCFLLMDKTFTTGLRLWENKPTALTGVGNAPLLPPLAASPPEGEILAALWNERLKLAL